MLQQERTNRLFAEMVEQLFVTKREFEKTLSNMAHSQLAATIPALVDSMNEANADYALKDIARSARGTRLARGNIVSLGEMCRYTAAEIGRRAGAFGRDDGEVQQAQAAVAKAQRELEDAQNRLAAHLSNRRA